MAPPTDPRVLLGMQMRAVLTRFAAWSRNHAGAPCPDSATLGVVAIDPWGHPIELTCTDQPADQVIGATSAGLDGIAGNGDDVTSWALGREVTNLVHGARWASTPAPTAAPPTTPAQAVRLGKERSPAHGHTRPSTLPGDAGTDDIPSRR